MDTTTPQAGPCAQSLICYMCDPNGRYKNNPLLVAKKARKAIHRCGTCERQLCNYCAEQCWSCKAWFCGMFCGYWDGNEYDDDQPDDFVELFTCNYCVYY